MSIYVRELTHEEIQGIFPFIKQLNSNMAEADFHRCLKIMLDKGYRCAGAFDEGGTLLGLSGFWVLCRFWCGEHVDIDNVVIDARCRSQGIGKALMEWIEQWAMARGITFAVLDAYTHNTASHKFYHREGYTIKGYHFIKVLDRK